MNYMTGQSLMYLASLVAGIFVFTTLIIFLVGGEITYGSGASTKTYTIEGISTVMGKTLTRNGN